MHFYPVNLRRLPFLVGAAVGLAFSASAQQGGEPIIFSSPDGEAVSSNLTQLAKPDDLPDTTSFAPSGFGPDLPSGEAPPISIPAAVSISEGQQLQQLLNPKKDWTTMTPEEIMGVTSSGKDFQAPERDAMGLRKNSSALENFMGRQSASQFAATNGFSSDNPVSAWHFSSNPAFQPGANALNPVSDNNNLGNVPQTLSQLYNFGRQNSGGDLLQKFSRSPSSPSSLNSSQPTEMDQFDQFQKMLETGSPVSTTPSSYNSDSSASFSPQPSPDNNFGQPVQVINPVGASYAPLTSGIGTPTGLPPLPTVTGQSSLQPVISPAWAPQTPPWMSQGPQPFVIPQRKF